MSTRKDFPPIPMTMRDAFLTARSTARLAVTEEPEHRCLRSSLLYFSFGLFYGTLQQIANEIEAGRTESAQSVAYQAIQEMLALMVDCHAKSGPTTIDSEQSSERALKRLRSATQAMDGGQLYDLLVCFENLSDAVTVRHVEGALRSLFREGKQS